MEMLCKYANDETLDAIDHSGIKTDSISYKNWYFALKDKLAKASAMLASPKAIRS